MIRWLVLSTILIAAQAHACDRPVCLTAPDQLEFLSEITFDHHPSAMGPGRPVEGILVEAGASFAERFDAQERLEAPPFDLVEGRPGAPLSLIAGEERRNLAILNLWGNNALNGQGPLGFPNDDASGEGAIAVLFDRDQSGFAFDLLGGEQGEAEVVIFTRSGDEIDRLTVSPLLSAPLVFQRRGQAADMAGFLLMNRDPAGIAIDNLRFDGEARTS